MTATCGPAPLPGAPAGGWHRRVWVLAGPIMLSNMTTPLLGAVDTAVVGQLPDAAYIGGVAIGAIVFSFLFWGFGFLRMGTTGFTAQAHGAGDHDELRATLLRPLVLALGLGALLVALQAPIGMLAFELLEASPEVEALAASYYEIRIWSAPAALVNYTVLGWLLGTQRARTALVLQVALNGVNVVLDLAFETLLTTDKIDERFTGGFGSGVVGDFLMRLEWPTQGFAFEAMVANIGTTTIKQLERDSASIFVATADPLNDLVDALDALSFETRDTVDVDVRLPRIVRFTASAWANRILQVDLSTTMPVGGEFETPLIMDVGTTWRFLKNLPLRAGLIIGGHQGLGYSGGFAFEARNMLFQVAGQSLGGFLKQAKGAGARFDFGSGWGVMLRRCNRAILSSWT